MRASLARTRAIARWTVRKVRIPTNLRAPNRVRFSGHKIGGRVELRKVAVACYKFAAAKQHAQRCELRAIERGKGESESLCGALRWRCCVRMRVDAHELPSNMTNGLDGLQDSTKRQLVLQIRFRPLYNT